MSDWKHGVLKAAQRDADRVRAGLHNEDPAKHRPAQQYLVEYLDHVDPERVDLLEHLRAVIRRKHVLYTIAREDQYDHWHAMKAAIEAGSYRGKYDYVCEHHGRNPWLVTRAMRDAVVEEIGYEPDDGEINNLILDALAAHAGTPTPLLHARTRQLEQQLEHAGGRGVDLAEELDQYRVALAARMAMRPLKITLGAPLLVPACWHDLAAIEDFDDLDHFPHRARPTDLASHLSDPTPYRDDSRMISAEDENYSVSLALSSGGSNYWLTYEIQQKDPRDPDFSRAQIVLEFQEAFHDVPNGRDWVSFTDAHDRAVTLEIPIEPLAQGDTSPDAKTFAYVEALVCATTDCSYAEYNLNSELDECPVCGAELSWHDSVARVFNADEDVAPDVEDLCIRMEGDPRWTSKRRDRFDWLTDQGGVSAAKAYFLTVTSESAQFWDDADTLVGHWLDKHHADDSVDEDTYGNTNELRHNLQLGLHYDEDLLADILRELREDAEQEDEPHLYPYVEILQRITRPA